MIEFIGGRTRARTWDPLIKSQRFSEQIDSEQIESIRGRDGLVGALGSGGVDHSMIGSAENKQQDYRRKDWTSAATRASVPMTLGF